MFEIPLKEAIPVAYPIDIGTCRISFCCTDEKKSNILVMSQAALTQLCKSFIHSFIGGSKWKTQKYKTITFFMDKNTIIYELEEDGLKATGVITSSPVDLLISIVSRNVIFNLVSP